MIAGCTKPQIKGQDVLLRDELVIHSETYYHPQAGQSRSASHDVWVA